MLRPALAIFSAMLLSALALSGCSDSSAPKPVTITFRSPAIKDNLLPALYTCDGKNISPPLEWGVVPSATKELAVFVLGLTPNTATGGYNTSVEWAVAGVNPSLHRLAAGELPPGAHVAVTNDGKTMHYSVCPAKGQAKSYQFALYAVPAAITIPPGFVGIKLLEVLASPQSPDEARAGGALLATYQRPDRAPATHRVQAQG